MAGEKVSVNFEVNTDSLEMIEKITDKYEMPDTSKTLRCLLDFVSENETDWDQIFKKVRCLRC